MDRRHFSRDGRVGASGLALAMPRRPWRLAAPSATAEPNPIALAVVGRTVEVNGRAARVFGLRQPGLITLTAAILVALVTAAGAQGIPDRQRPSGFVYTADEKGNSISAIDLATGEVETVPIAISPHNVQVAADGARLLAVGDRAADTYGHAGTGHAGKPEGQLVVLASKSLTSGPVASISVGDHPAHVVADRESRYAFVTVAHEDGVAVIDLTANEVVRTIDTGRYPHGLRISPDGSTIYAANVEDGSVSVIDTAKLAEVARIHVGEAPVQVGFTPDGSRVYVSLRDENSVAVIDTGTRTVVARIAVERNPIQLHATPDGRFVYVANQGSEEEPANTVSVIDVARGIVVDTIRTGAGAHGVAVSDDGRHVFVTNIVDGTVSMIDAASRSVVATFAVGRGPNGITFATERD